MGGIADDPANSNPAEYPVASATRHVVVDADLTVNGHGARAAGRADRDARHVHRRRHRPRPDVVHHRADQRPGATAEGARRRHRRSRPACWAASSTRPARCADSLAALDDGLDRGRRRGPKIPLIEQTAGGLLAQGGRPKGKIDALRSGPTPVDLADVETKLQNLLGNADPADDLVGFALRDDDPADGTVDPSLVLRFDVDKSDSAALPLSLDVCGLPSLTSSGEQGNVTATLAGSLDLGVVVPLNAEGTPTPPVRILDSSQVSVTGSVTENPPGSAQLSVNLGALSAQLGDSTNHTGRLGFGAKVVRRSRRRTRSRRGRRGARSRWATTSTPASTSASTSADPSGTFTCSPPGGHRADAGHVRLPVAARPDHPLRVAEDAGGSAPDSPAEGDYLKVDDQQPDRGADRHRRRPTWPRSSTPWPSRSTDWATASPRCPRSSRSRWPPRPSAAQLPLVGEDLSKLASGLTDLKTFLDNPGAVLNVPFDADPTVEEVLFDTGGLRDKLHTALDGAGHPARQLLPARLRAPTRTPPPRATSASCPVCNGALCALSADATTIDEIRVEMELGEGTPATGEDLPIDLGLPGLPLSFKADDARQGARGLDARAGLRPLPRRRLLPARQPRARHRYPGHGAVRRSAGAPRRRSASTCSPPPPCKIRGTIGFIPLEATDNKTGGDNERSEHARPGRDRRPGWLLGAGRAVQHRAGLRLLHRQDLGHAAAVRRPLAVPHRTPRSTATWISTSRSRPGSAAARSTRRCPVSPPTSR